MVRIGSDYYAFTTGTVLGNHLQALVDTSGSPESGWRSYTGTSYGSSALPNFPSWEQVNTQTSPGVFNWHGTWLMYYDAAQYGHAGDTGYNCLAVATAAALTPTRPGVHRPLPDPPAVPTLLGRGDRPEPVRRSSDRQRLPGLEVQRRRIGPTCPSVVPAAERQRPVAGGVSPDPADPGHESTIRGRPPIENPDMVDVGGTYILLFSTGQYNSSTYSENFATCAGPAGPCTQGQSSPLLSSYGSAAGPGGGSLFQDASGNWYLGYAAWRAWLYRLLLWGRSPFVRLTDCHHAGFADYAGDRHGIDPDRWRVLVGQFSRRGHRAR